MPIRGRTVVRAFVAFGIWVELRPEALSPAIPRTRRIRHVVELVVKLDLFASLVTLLSVLPFLFSSFFFPSFRSFPGTNRTSQALAPCPQAGESDRYAKLRACNEVTRDRNQLSCGSALRRARVCFDPSIFLPIFPRFSRARDNFELIDRGEYLWREIESAKYIRATLLVYTLVEAWLTFRLSVVLEYEIGEKKATRGWAVDDCLERFRIERSLIYRGR